MSDWLSSDDDGGYLGLDDPPMPDGAPAAPTQGDAAGGDWLGGDAGGDAGGDWLGGSASTGSAPVSDTQGEWIANDSQAWTQAPAEAAPDPYASQAAPPAQQQYSPPPPQPMPAQHQQPQHHGGGLMVGPPSLEEVAPSHRSLGGTRGELSNLVLDVEVQVEVGLGNSALTVEEFLEMGRGSVVELDTPIDAPIELKVRGKLVARGQLVSIGGSYGMRITEMLGEE